jgi:DNA-directed RNA polymerase specialized sigma24 family protein
LKKDWEPDPGALKSLVEWLDGRADARSDGEAYVAMHARLSSYFARKGCRAPEELADETLSRVARRLQEEGTIAGMVPAQYCYVTARFVWLEHLRSPDYAPPAITRDPKSPVRPAGEDEERERWLACLDRCLEQLETSDRAIILEYYSGASSDRIEQRRQLAARLGLTANALAIRASRLRERLRTAVRQCISGA